MIRWTTDEASAKAMTDEQLSDAYQRTDGESEEAEVLRAEIERRNLDV